MCVVQKFPQALCLFLLRAFFAGASFFHIGISPAVGSESRPCNV